MTKNIYTNSILILLACAPIFLIALDINSIGYILLIGVSLLTYIIKNKEEQKAYLIIMLCLLILNMNPISTYRR